MKTKEFFYLGKTAQGVFAQSLFGSAGIFEKTAGAPPFADWETGEDLRKYIRTISAKDRKSALYILVNALGAGEYYGNNINGDNFPWDALAHDGEDYGHKTFLKAHNFQHHINKNPEKAIGAPVVSVLNPRMKRVELIVRIDRDKAKTEGAGGVLSRIESGEFPDVSMGARVPFDRCTICNHKSKTREDYCEHLRPPPEMRDRWGINKILPDGRQIGMINDYPRFFDISFVFIGADKCAKVMAKLAARGERICLGAVCAVPSSPEEEVQTPILYDAIGGELLSKTAAGAVNEERGPCGRPCATCSERQECRDQKLASAFGAKTASQAKRAEIVKNIPASSFVVKTLPKLERTEPDISPKDLDHLSAWPLRQALGAATRAGIILKPHEFQHIVLRRMGEMDLLDELESRLRVFRQGKAVRAEDPVDPSDPLDTVFDVLRTYIKSRTGLGIPFQIRVVVAGGGVKNALPTREPVEHPLLDKVGAAYHAYRRSLLGKLAQAAEAVHSDPGLREEVLGDELSNMFAKQASQRLVTLNSTAYFLGAYLDDRGLLSPYASALQDEWLLGGDHTSA